MPDNALMNREISCRNFIGLIDYIRKNYGDPSLPVLLDGLVDNPAYLIRDKFDPAIVSPVSLHHLLDTAQWVSNEFSLALFTNIKRVMTDQPDPLFVAGAGVVHENLSRTVLYSCKLLGFANTARMVTSINARFNRTKDVRLIEVSDRAAVFHLHYKPGFRVTRDVCRWNLGIYTELARLTGLRNIRPEETECVLDGCGHCTFRFSYVRDNPVKRFFKWVRDRMVAWISRELIEDYEKTALERDQLLSRLIRSEEKYRALFRDSMDAMSLTIDGKLVDVNPAWLQLHGHERIENVLHRDILDFVYPDDHAVLEKRRLSWQHPRERIYRTRDICRDGTVRHVEVYSSRIVLDGNVSILATVRDVTQIIQEENDRKRLDERIRQAEKMEVVGTLASGVAHDLNNILSGIVCYPDLILMQLPPDDPLRKPVASIRESGLKAAAVVEDMLTLARRGVTVREPVNLNILVNKYLQSPEFIKLNSQHPEMVIHTVLDEALLNILGSSVHLTKTLMNLVTNGAEAMPNGGPLIIRTENRYIDPMTDGDGSIAEGDYVILTVEDSGIGIRDEDRDKIFLPFYTKKMMGRSGTGLGMAVVWGTVKDHAGFVHIDSASGRGTAITIILPATRESVREISPDIRFVPPAGRQETILVVDDIEEQRTVASQMLFSLGYRVIAVPSGEAAVEYLKTGRCDLLLLDMIMNPGMDGLDTYTQAIQLHPGQKAIIASGYCETERVKEAMRMGAGRYLKKPYTLQNLSVAIREELDRPKI